MSVLKTSLMKMYAGNDEIIDMLAGVDYTELDKRYQTELYSRISKEDVALAESILLSDLIYRYDQATVGASMAMTRQLSEVLEFVLSTNKGELQ